MNKEEDYIGFYRDAVIGGHDAPAAETMRRFHLSRDYTVRLLNEAIARCDGQDIRNWNRRMRSPEIRKSRHRIPARSPVSPAFLRTAQGSRAEHAGETVVGSGERAPA
jgi:hypothetical protein